jgi:chromosome segregation ATPase
VSYSLSQAAKGTGRSKATIHRAIQSHKISAERDEAGAWRIDPAELHRVFPPVSPEPEQKNDLRRNETEDGTAEMQRRFAELQQERERERADKDAVIADLRRRLDEANLERRQNADRLAAAQERIAALLTDQRQATPAQTPVRRKWWPWRG